MAKCAITLQISANTYYYLHIIKGILSENWGRKAMGLRSMTMIARLQTVGVFSSCLFCMRFFICKMLLVVFL